jgi:hypothetical protein
MCKSKIGPGVAADERQKAVLWEQIASKRRKTAQKPKKSHKEETPGRSRMSFGKTGCTSVASLCGGTLIPVFGKFSPISGGVFA